MASTLYIGLLSGTSMDAVDAVLADLGPRPPRILQALAHPIPEPLKARLRAISDPAWRGDLDEYGALDAETGALFAEAAQALLDRSGLGAGAIAAIGSHGQTVRHRPDGRHPFSLQIGDAARIAEATGIAVVSDFRRRDIAAGGQGAPLVPAFHAELLRSTEEDRAVLNLGGIANLTCLPAAPGQPVTGFDTGPANTLLDHWARRHTGTPFDRDGRWAATGQTAGSLLDAMLEDPYFGRPAPKSTGPEHFGAEWLDGLLEGMPEQRPQDVQRTLVELTAHTVAQAVERHAPQTASLHVCGGGVHNGLLMDRIAASLPGRRVVSTAEAGIDPDFIEALAFAWLASRTLAGLPGNLPAVTGARHAVVMGTIHPMCRRPVSGR